MLNMAELINLKLSYQTAKISREANSLRKTGHSKSYLYECGNERECGNIEIHYIYGKIQARI